MGASYSERTGYGKNLSEAWGQVHNQASWESGHEYSGDFGSKYDAVEVTVPKGLKAGKFLNLAHELLDLPSEEKIADIERDVKSFYKGEAKKRYAKIAREWRRERTRFDRKVKPEHRFAVERLAAVIDDKWGPAAAVELTGSELKAAKQYHGIVGRRGLRVWKFAGYCSS